MDYVWNGVSLVGVITALFTLIVICVPKLRQKFVEYVILKHDEDEQVKQIKQLQAQVTDLTGQVKELQLVILDLSTQLAACKALLNTQTHQ